MKKEIDILLAEDDQSLGFVIKDNLTDLGYNVVWKKNGTEAAVAYQRGKFDLYLLDVMMPEMDGFSLAQEIRKADKQTPIIFLTAKSLKEDKITGFKSGADDYITKPFSIEELMLRIEAVLKRTMQSNPLGKSNQSEFAIGNYKFEYASFRLTCKGEDKKLTKKEGEILRLLCIHKNEVLPRETILNMVWGKDDYFTGRSMDVFISKLRKHLADDPGVQIENIHGVGFKLTES